MRQERLKHRSSTTTHGTMESWDFNSTETNPSAPSIPLGSRRDSSGGTPRGGSLDLGSDDHHQLARLDSVHPRFELSRGIKEETASIMPASDSTFINVQDDDLESEKMTEFLPSGSQARVRYGESQSSRLDSSFPASPLAHVGVPNSPRSTVPVSIPIPQRASSNFRKLSFSTSIDGAASVPTSAPSSVSPKLWQRLTRATSRNAVDEELPVKEKKASALSRVLNRRSSASLAQRR